jgi:abortive infection bacteriophage resistance protein
MEAYQASFFMTEKRPFTKPPTDIKEQIAILEKRGMLVEDKDLASRHLRFIGYYRLSGYAHYFRTPNDGYQKGTTFEAVIEHYNFDRQLRILLFDVLEHIEIALRNAITLVMTERHGAFWFNNASIFVTNIGAKIIDGYGVIIQSIREATIERRDKDIFLKHYYQPYSSPELPPSWVVMETLSMGIVSKMFSLLQVEERKAIAAIFQIKERHLVSWIRSLTYTRNLCAHHSRLWNRIFTLKVEADKRYAICRDGAFQRGKLYAQTVIIAIMLNVIAPDNQWEQRIKKLMGSFPHKYASDMGFPENWTGYDLIK